MAIGWMAAGLMLATMQAAPQVGSPGPATDASRTRGPVIWDGGRSAVEAPPPQAIAVPADGTGDIAESIRDGKRSGQLSRKKARRLRRQAGRVAARTSVNAQDGLSHAEVQDIAFQTEALRGIVVAERTQGIMNADRPGAPRR